MPRIRSKHRTVYLGGRKFSQTAISVLSDKELADLRETQAGRLAFANGVLEVLDAEGHVIPEAPREPKTHGPKTEEPTPES